MEPVIQLYTGRYFDYRHPDRNVYDIEDLAHALSNLCRYTGHTQEFYSVAQHSVLVSKVCPPQHALLGLLHDAAEAYLGDVNSPLKTLLPEYKVLEKRVEECLLRSFGLRSRDLPHVKPADLTALATEKRDLMPGHSGDYWAVLDKVPLSEERIVALTPEEAKWSFLHRYYELRGETE